MLKTLIRSSAAFNRLIDTVEHFVPGKTQLPPYSLRRLVGAPIRDFSGAEFLAEGVRFRERLEEAAGLRAGMRVGDVGCGCGRMAAPILQKYDVSYAGFDIVPTLVRWCTEHIEPHYPKSRFDVLDVYNSRYNPSGRTDPANTVFPFEDTAFDLIHASSVFTHLMQGAAARYFQEIARSLDIGGKAVATFFLLDIEHPRKTEGASAAAGVDARMPSATEFAFSDGLAHYVFEDVPELMVGYNLRDLEELCGAVGLEIELFSAGSWKHGGVSKTWQDMCTLRKRRS